ncbi:hypothetical protein LCGC14_2245890, partial [marine sediment metagenome]
MTQSNKKNFNHFLVTAFILIGLFVFGMSNADAAGKFEGQTLV